MKVLWSRFQKLGLVRLVRSIRAKARVSDYWRSVALVFSGTAFAQVIPLFGSLLIARLFIPAEFGLFSAWLGMTTMASVMLTGRLEMALPLEPDGPQRGVAAMAVLATAGIMAVFLTLATIPLIFIRQTLMHGTPIGLVLGFGPASFILAAYQIWNSWAAAEGSYRVLSVMRIGQAFVITCLQIGVGFLAPTAETLAFTYMVGVFCGVAIAAHWLPMRALPRPRLLTIWSFLKRYRRFPIFSMPADSINTAAVQLPLLIIAARFGAESAGFLALAMRTLGAPISLLGKAVLDVFKRRSSSGWRERGECRSEYVQTFRVLAVISLLSLVAFILFGEKLFVFAFGEEWRMAGVISVWLIPLFALRFVASPLSFIFYVAQKQHVDLVWQILLLGMTLVTLLSLSSLPTTLQVYSFGYSALYVLYLFLSFRLSRGDGK